MEWFTSIASSLSGLPWWAILLVVLLSIDLAGSWSLARYPVGLLDLRGQPTRLDTSPWNKVTYD